MVSSKVTTRSCLYLKQIVANQQHVCCPVNITLRLNFWVPSIVENPRQLLRQVSRDRFAESPVFVVLLQRAHRKLHSETIPTVGVVNFMLHFVYFCFICNRRNLFICTLSTTPDLSLPKPSWWWIPSKKMPATTRIPLCVPLLFAQWAAFESIESRSIFVIL